MRFVGRISRRPSRLSPKITVLAECYHSQETWRFFDPLFHFSNPYPDTSGWGNFLFCALDLFTTDFETYKRPMNKHFEGKWALVLGASSGFGEAACSRLSEAGLNIFGVHLDRKATQPNAERIQAEIKARGRDSHFFNINAADDACRAEVIAVMRERAPGRVHILLHSLAFGALKPFIADNSKDRLSKAQVEMTIDVMASSLVYWAQDMASAQLFAPNGRIFAMSSAGSGRVWKSYGAVSAAKAALESYCRQLALELAPIGVTANAILAGVTDTPALRKIPGNEEMILTAAKRNPFGRLTRPDDVAQSLVALSLPHCDFITGNTIRIDGGENIVD